MDTQPLYITLLEQGQNTLTSMDNLKKKANRKGDQRAALYENFRANEHSFRVYTFADPEIGERAEVQAFLEKVEAFEALFQGVDTERETNVDSGQSKELYEQAVEAYNSMDEKLKNN